MFRAWIFYPLVALAAAALIAASFGPAPFRDAPAPQAGVRQEGAIVFTAEALARSFPGVGATSIAYQGWSPTGFRVAAPPGTVEPTGDAARLKLTPDAAQALAGKPLIVEILVRPVPLTTAPELAVGLESGGAIAWARSAIAPEPGLVRLTFAPTPGPVDAIALTPLVPGQDRPLSVEIGEIRIRPQS